MRDGLPLSHVYNLARLGQAGDLVSFTATAEEREAITHWSGIRKLENLSAKIDIQKLSPSRFGLDVALDADLVQACVITLEPVPSHIAREFTRELHFAGPVRRGPKPADAEAILITHPDEDDPPEEIDSLQYDLAGPVLEEFLLSLDPYPKIAGAELGVKSVPGEQPESPFAVLKNLK